MTLSYPIIAGCWAIFLLFWIVSAFFVKPTFERVTFSTAILVRIALSIGIFLLLTRRGSVSIEDSSEVPQVWRGSVPRVPGRRITGLL